MTQDIRALQQIEVLDTFESCCGRLDDCRRYEKDVAANKLGYNWTNIIDLYPNKARTMGQIEMGISALRELDYIVTVERKDDNTIFLKVSTTNDAADRHRE